MIFLLFTMNFQAFSRLLKLTKHRKRKKGPWTRSGPARPGLVGKAAQPSQKRSAHARSNLGGASAFAKRPLSFPQINLQYFRHYTSLFI